MKYKKYETERLIFRPTQTEDATFILELLNTPQWLTNIGDRNVKTLKDAENYIAEKMLPQLKKLGFSNNTVIRKSDNKIVGSCGLYKRDGLENVDLGFAFLPEFQKQGYAFESSKKLVEIAFSELDITILNAITTKENIASQKLLVKLGFTFSKIISIPNDTEKLLLFELKNEFFNLLLIVIAD